MRDVSVQSDEVMLQFGWYAAQSAGQEHEVVHNMADEIVRLREALTAATRVTDAMRLALDVLTWQMEARSRCGDPDAECPLQDACKPSHGHTLAIAALTAALEGQSDQ